MAGDATTRLIQAVERITGKAARKQGREWLVLCPVHDDHEPSGNIREGDGGYPIWQCRSHGCTMEQVLEVVGLTWGDVFGNEDDHWTPRGPWVAIYDYTDEKGTLLFQVCRTADKQFPQRHPNPAKQSGWEWNLNGTRRVPFRLPRVLEAAAVGEVVYIVEGEKDALALEKLGVIATCNPGGAGKWRDEYSMLLGIADCVVIADNDLPGRQHALAVAASLRRRDGGTVQVLLPKEGKDIADHLAGGHRLDALLPLAEGVAAIVDAPLVEVSADEDGAPRLRFLTGLDFRKQPLSRIEPLIGTEDDALMMPGSLVLLAGIGGSGKTTLALHAVAHWGAGLPWFGFRLARPMRTIIIESEGPHDPFCRKLDQFTERFHNCTCSGEPHGESAGIDENTWVLDAPWGKFTFDDQDYAAQLREMVKEVGADLVVANPLGRLGMKGAGTPEETRAFVSLLAYAGLGEEFAALLVHHLAKTQPNTPLVQQISGDWAAHPDSILVMEAAGERRSKLSFGKVRWGDQGRSPLILDWLTDPEGPIGYRVQGREEQNEEFDQQMYERIDAFLGGQGEPVSITAIRTAVKGKNKRLGELIMAGIETGRYQAIGVPPRLKFYLTTATQMSFDEPILEGEDDDDGPRLD